MKLFILILSEPELVPNVDSWLHMYFHIYPDFLVEFSLKSEKLMLSVAFKIFRINSSVCVCVWTSVYLKCSMFQVFGVRCSMLDARCMVYYIQLIHRLNWLLCFSFAIEHSPIRLTHVFLGSSSSSSCTQVEHIDMCTFLCVLRCI